MVRKHLPINLLSSIQDIGLGEDEQKDDDIFSLSDNQFIKKNQSNFERMEGNNRYYKYKSNKYFFSHDKIVMITNQQNKQEKKNIIIFSKFDIPSHIGNKFIAYFDEEEIEIQCYVNHQEFLQIAPQFRFLEKLKNLTLKVDSNDFLSMGLQILAQCLVNMTQLTQLSLDIASDCGIGQEGASALGYCLRYLHNLKHLYLSIQRNEINKKGAISIGDGLSEIKSLETLSLVIGKDNQIGEEGIISICQGIASSKENLKKLNISIGWFNKINATGGESIANCIEQLQNLDELFITIRKDNHLQKEGLNLLIESIHKIRSLKVLKFSVRELYSEEHEDLDISKLILGKDLLKIHLKLVFDLFNLSRFCLAINDQKNLQYLSLKLVWYNINHKNIQELGQAIKQLTGLKTLLIQNKLFKFEPNFMSLFSKYLLKLDRLQYFVFLNTQYPNRLTFKENHYQKIKRLVKYSI